MSKTRTQLIALLEPSIEVLGYELVDLELIFGGRGAIRLFIDRLVPADEAVATGESGGPVDGPRDSGIGVEDCEAVSRQVSALLDVEDPIGRDYDLEVSSPGLDRKLTKPAHFDRFAGREVQGRFCRMMDGRRRFAGMLLARNGPMVTIRVENADLTVALEDLEVVRLVPEY
ncbi:MAG: ribosome maturation factor RimP [Gammaproteobacteria bacterium]